LDIPIKPVFEHAVPQSMHLGNIADEITVVVGRYQLHHGRLLE
jgi:hypothetical protein